MNTSTFAASLLNFFTGPTRAAESADTAGARSTAAPFVFPTPSAGKLPRLMPLVIVADPNEAARHRLSRELQRTGVVVLQCKSTAECLEAAPTSRPDLMLLNLQMTLDENLTAATLRECTDKAGQPPVIFLAGSQDQQTLARVQSYLNYQQRKVKLDLELAEIESTPVCVGAAKVAPHTKDLAPVLRLAEWIFQPVATAKKITLKIEAPAAGLLAECDEIRVQRVVENLLSNAIRYSPANTTVTLGAKIENGTLQVWVDDEGPGIPLAEQADLFTDADSYRGLLDDEETGSDRGLVVCQHIASTLHGKIEMHNRREGGAHFEFSLPASGARRVTAAAALSDRLGEGKVTTFTTSAKPGLIIMHPRTSAVA